MRQRGPINKEETESRKGKALAVKSKRKRPDEKENTKGDWHFSLKFNCCFSLYEMEIPVFCKELIDGSKQYQVVLNFLLLSLILVVFFFYS